MKLTKINVYSLIVISASVMMSACFSPVKTDPGSAYLITATPCVYPSKAKRSTILLVSLPDTNPAYNTTQMAYTMRPYQISYFSHNRWAETPAEMLLPLIAKTLQNTQRFRAVITPPYTGRYDYELNTRITVLEQDFICRPTMLRLGMHAQLNKVSLNRVVATKDFLVEIPIRHGSPYNGVLAANRATAIMLAKLAEFTVENSR